MSTMPPLLSWAGVPLSVLNSPHHKNSCTQLESLSTLVLIGIGWGPGAPVFILPKKNSGLPRANADIVGQSLQEKNIEHLKNIFRKEHWPSHFLGEHFLALWIELLKTAEVYLSVPRLFVISTCHTRYDQSLAALSTTYSHSVIFYIDVIHMCTLSSFCLSTRQPPDFPGLQCMWITSM